MKILPLLVISHAVALAAGWFLFRVSAEKQTASADTRSPPLKKNRVEFRRERVEENRRILSDLTTRWKDQLALYERMPQRSPAEFQERRTRSREDSERNLDEIHKLSLTIILPADPGSYVDGLNPFSLEPAERERFPAIVAAWLKADPAAAIAYFSKTEDPSKKARLANSVHAWLKYEDPGKALAALEAHPQLLNPYGVIAIKRAVAQDPSRLGSLLDLMDGKLDRSTILRGAFADLPEKSRGPALEWIHANLKGREAADAVAHAAISLSHEDAAAAKEFLKLAIERNPDPANLAQLKSWGNYSEIMRSGLDRNSSMEERVEAALSANVAGKTDEQRRENAIRSIASQDTMAWFRESAWEDDIRNGSATPAEVWAAAEQELPHLASSGRSALIESLFSEISMIDPTGALALVREHGDPAKLSEYVRQSVERNSFNNIEASVRLVQSLPDETIRSQLGSYDKTYRSLVSVNATKGDPFWTEWVKGQPEGLSRDLLLHYTARRYFRNGNETQGTALKAMIRDTTVKSWPRF